MPLPLKVTLRGGAEIDVDPAWMATWKLAYPCMDVDGEIRKLLIWCHDNPTRRPVKYARGFIGKNLAKADKRANPPDWMVERMRRIIGEVNEGLVGLDVISQEDWLGKVRSRCEDLNKDYSERLVRLALNLDR